MQNSIHFLQPFWFAGLLVPLFWWLVAKNKQLVFPSIIQQTKVRYPALELTGSDRADKDQTTILPGFYLPAIFLILLLLSLAQPVRYGETLPAEVQKEPVDLILVVNTSVSMTLNDYMLEGKQLDRMAMTRLLLQQLVREFKGRRIALIILGRPSSVWLPLTTDFSLVENMIGRIKTTLGGRNSDIGETLALIQKQFSLDQPSIADQPAINTSKQIVMLVSDGYDQLGVSSPESAVKELLQDGFQLHALAIGSSNKPEFSLGKGHLIYQPVDLRLMTRLSSIGEGKVVHVKDLSAIDVVLNNIKTPVIDNGVEIDKRQIISLYQYPLILALLILLIMLLPVSWSRVFTTGKMF